MNMQQPNEVMLNSAIFQGFCINGEFQQAFCFAEHNIVDNSCLYGVKIPGDKSLFEFILRGIENKTEIDFTKVWPIILRTNMDWRSCNPYEIIYERDVIPPGLLTSFVNEQIPFDLEPSALNVLARLVSKSDFLHKKCSKNLRFQTVIEHTKKCENAYVIFNRFEHCNGDMRIASALDISICTQNLSNVSNLMLAIPFVDLDVFRYETNEWWSAEKCLKSISTNPHPILTALIYTGRTILEHYRAKRLTGVLELHRIEKILPKEICELINSFGERPFCG